MFEFQFINNRIDVLLFITFTTFHFDSMCQNKEEYRKGVIHDLIEFYKVTPQYLVVEDKNAPIRYYSFTYFDDSDSEYVHDDEFAKKHLDSLIDNIPTQKFNQIVLNSKYFIGIIKDSLITEMFSKVEKYNDYGIISYLLSAVESIDKKEALRHINYAIEVNPMIEEFYLQKTRILYSEKDYNQIIKEYDKILSFTDDACTYHHYKFLLYKIINDDVNALKEITKAIDKYDFNAIQKAQNNSVIEDFEFNLQKGKLGGYYYERYLLHKNMNEKDKACDDLKKANKFGFSKNKEYLEYCN